MIRGFSHGLQIRVFLVVIMFFGLCCQAQDKSSPRIQERTTSIAHLEEALNTPGATAELRPIHKEFKGGLHYSKYDIYVSGIPRDQPYIVYQWPLQAPYPSPAVKYEEFYISDDGRLCRQENECHDGVGPYLQMEFVSARGEPHRIVLFSKDSKYKVAVMVTPNPIVVTDQGCRVEVIRGTPKFESAILRVEGFTPGETVETKFNSAGKIVKKKIKIDPKGKFVLELDFKVEDKHLGEEEVSFKAANCNPVVSYHWGEIYY